jgi:cytochrome c551/c552
MSRLKIILGTLCLLCLLVWGGFRIWLVQQEPSFRAGIEAFSTIEFLALLYDMALPQDLPGAGEIGRRDYPGRGHSPWVLRTSLDGRPRMLSLAIGPDEWLSYSTETASIHQYWRGGIHFTGPVYDAKHGGEPTSTGTAFLRQPEESAWLVREGDAWIPARVRWRGHGFDPDTGALWLRFELMTPSGAAVRVTEWPERLADGGRTGLERRFLSDARTTPSIALRVRSGASTLEVENARISDTSRIVLEPGETRIVHWFDEPTIPIQHADAVGEEPNAFSEHDCQTCHGVRERIVGPAWSEIALRYQGTNESVTVTQLASRIVEGSDGRWGNVPMSPHPDLTRSEAERLARRVLATEPAEAMAVEVESGGAEATWIYGSSTQPRPDRLHPSLSTTRLSGRGFDPRVGGLAWLPDGRLGVSTWDRDGAVYAIEGWQDGRESVVVERIAEGLHEPLGLAVVDDEIYVMQKQEVTQLIDSNGDGWTDEYRTLSADWRVTSNFHEFGFGLVDQGEYLYGALSVCILNGGKSCREQTPDRGKVFRVSTTTGILEFLASGLRTPNGLGFSADGDLFVTDNQGDWLPASKLIRISPGAFYGWRAPADEQDLGPSVPPTLWLPQNEVGNSPTQPLFLTHGPYQGHVLFGDVFNGGIKRAYLEEVDGQLQGAAFHFTAGLRAPVNRLLEAPGGGIVVGQVGSDGNWGEFGKDRHGIEFLRFSDETAFEPLRVTATVDGFDIHFSRAISADLAVGPEHFSATQWFYIPSEVYGGPKYDLTSVTVSDVRLSRDRTVASLSIDGLEEGNVVYLEMDRRLRSEAGEPLWINEAWYTLTARPEPTVATEAPESSSPLNTLTPAEEAEGWRLLFDGESFDGWKIYGGADDTIEGWTIEEGALKFTRDVSFAGLIWNHVNPLRRAALDLMTEDRFGDFELSIEWKISEGGNSGIFYLVPDEEAALSWTYGLEMQVLDDQRHSDGQLDRRRAGDLYDLKASVQRAAKAAGEWNRARIRVEKNRIEHSLNGVRLLEIVRGSAEWDQAMAASKFAGTEGMGTAKRGHITLQDHGDIVWYRNIKIRELP